MGRWLKRLVALLAIGFVLFYLVNQPQGAADAVRGVFAALARAVGSIITFFNALAG